MARDFIPRPDAELVGYAANFAGKIFAAPADYRVSADDAAACRAAQLAYAAAHARAVDPQTRGLSTVFAKNTARADLVYWIRRLARQIQHAPGVTDQHRLDLRLTVRKPRRSAVAVPTTAPSTDVAATVMPTTGTAVTVRLRNPDSPSGRARPDDVWAADVLHYIGDHPPATLAGWAYDGLTNGTSTTIPLPPDLPPGTKVWVTTRWWNRRSQAGPLSAPLVTRIPFAMAG